MATVRKVYKEDFELVYPLFVQLNHSRANQDCWRQIFINHWNAQEDYFGYGGRSEFCGHPLEIQMIKVKDGLKKFDSEKIKIRSFYAPNHTYDKNTLNALKNSGINEIIDGYGLMPYTENNIKFIPQLFYKIFLLPFGIQSTQIHLNYWKQKDFDNFEKFILNNSNKIITYDQALEKINNNLFYKLINFLTKIILKTKRIIKK